MLGILGQLVAQGSGGDTQRPAGLSLVPVEGPQSVQDDVPLDFAQRVGLLTREKLEPLLEMTDQIGRMLNKLQQGLRE